MDTISPGKTGIAEINLGALANNFRTIVERLGGVRAGCAVKANAYGLGIERISQTLWREGCRDFFIATLDEGVELRNHLPEATVYVLNGMPTGCEAVFWEYSLIPVLNTTKQAALWKNYCASKNEARSAMLHIDTGMNRLGVPPGEAEQLAQDGDVPLLGVMSHLVCGRNPDHEMNARQRKYFAKIAGLFTGLPASLANSAGVFLGPEYHFDLARPGIALFGGAPLVGQSNPMKPVVNIKVQILQDHVVESGDTVGYDATWRADGPRRIATLAAGYADGYPSGSNHNRGHVVIDEHLAPIVGRVSMDLITVDVTDLPVAKTEPGQWVTLIGLGRTLDQVADDAGISPYEVLTGLGHRYQRIYTE